MKNVSDIKELMATIQLLNNYLKTKIDPEYDFALNLIQKGTCFVAIGSPGDYKFYPSRFIGYVNNTMDTHIKNDEKDGRETNAAISFILGQKPLNNPCLNMEYLKYCERLGLTPREKGAFGVDRKFWILQNKN